MADKIVSLLENKGLRDELDRPGEGESPELQLGENGP